MKKRVEVVRAELANEQTELVARRRVQMSLSGIWEFPDGKIEQEEMP